MKNRKAFSFVELIIVVSILVLLSVVFVSINNSMQKKSINSRVESDLQTVKNSLNSYLSETKKVPLPKGNLNFFSSTGVYVHDDFTDSKITNPETYGVYGKITENTLPKSYFSSAPIDPRTNEYYSYGVLKNGTEFEIAGVLAKKDYFIAKVHGNYKAEEGIYNLIREYNGAEFVEDKKSHLPYNPYERKLVVTDETGKVYGVGETITSGTSEKYLYFSDGSVMKMEPNTKLTLNKLDFPKENKLLSKIKLTLDAGVIWTKATKLLGDGQDDNSSSFTVSAGDTTAAVRGTIFKMEKTVSNTTITVIEGKVEVSKNNDTSMTPKSIKKGEKIQINGSAIGSIESSTITETKWKNPKEGVENKGAGALIKLEKELAKKEAEKLSKNQGICYFEGYKKESGDEFTGYIKQVSENCNSDINSIRLKCENGDLFQKNGDSWVAKDIKYAYNYCKTVYPFYACQGSSWNTESLSNCVKYSDIYGNESMKPDDGLTSSGYELVAYAPYNKVGDLGLYIKGDLLSRYSSGGEPFEQSHLAIDGDNNKFYNLSSGNFMTKQNNWTETSMFSLDTNGNEYNFNDTCSSYKSTSSNDDTCDNAIFVNEGGEKGIYMAKKLRRFLKYNIAPLGLGDNWAIEMSVRGEALSNNNNEVKNLFYGESNLRVSTNTSNELKFFTTSPTPTSPPSLPFSLDDDKYYSVILKKGSLYIKDTAYSTPISNDAYNIGNHLYIGTSKNLNIRTYWNDVIDYIKIYKKIPTN